MMNLIETAGLAYLAVSGTVTGAAVAGRGLLRAARTALDGDRRGAVAEALGGLAAPAVMACGAVAELYAEAAEAAWGLATPPLDEVFERRAFDRVA